MAMTKHNSREFNRAVLEEFFTAPLSTPPSGVAAQLDHAKNRNKEVFAFVIIGSVLIIATLVARAYSCVLVTKQWYAEDCKFCQPCIWADFTDWAIETLDLSLLCVFPRNVDFDDKYCLTDADAICSAGMERSWLRQPRRLLRASVGLARSRVC